ncbi:MAG: septum formation protein Maf [Clostridia bacterium]|nr:septum formation protein Maf [Clostridia bacterium]
MRVILASKSPRRKELLSMMGVEFDVMVCEKPEILPPNTDIINVPKVLAEQKAENIFNETNGDRVVIGSDTIVTLNGIIYGKPNKEKTATQMLKELSGKSHEVITGLAVIIERSGQKKIYSKSVVTKVKFKKLTDAEIEFYVNTHEPDDKAGAYGLQGIAGMFIEKIDGNMASVIGLPTCDLYKILKKEDIICM